MIIPRPKYTEEELEWIIQGTGWYDIKEDCPEDLRISIEEKFKLYKANRNKDSVPIA